MKTSLTATANQFLRDSYPIIDEEKPIGGTQISNGFDRKIVNKPKQFRTKYEGIRTVGRRTVGRTDIWSLGQMIAVQVFIRILNKRTAQHGHNKLIWYQRIIIIK